MYKSTVRTSDNDGYVHFEKESYVYTYSHLVSTSLSCILLFDRVDRSISGDLKEIFDICSLLSAVSENLILCTRLFWHVSDHT